MVNFSLLNTGTRIALRNKVADSLFTGIRLVDLCLPIGRGQRQLVLGDKGIGKTAIFVYSLLSSLRINVIYSFDGLNSKRLFGLYIGININLSKLFKLITSVTSSSSSSFVNSLSMFSSNNSLLSISNYFFIVLATHSSSSALLSFILPYLGISIAERLRDRGFDSLICFDDFSKHAKSYRQVCLLLGRVPSRDAYSADIFNIHSSLLERSGKLRINYYGGAITAFPIIETINSDITEFIATNVISITDGQLYLSKRLFLDSIRPAIDSALSVSRIGSNAQCKFIKSMALGLKNELTNLRISYASSFNISSILLMRLFCLNIIFMQYYLIISTIE